MNEITVTVTGNLTVEPRHVVTDVGLPITSFRMASTVRRPERGTGRYVDAGTTFLTVTCFRSLAVNAAASLHKGQPVVVQGRLRVRDWEAEGRRGTSVEVEAYAVGHDLSLGASEFRRVARAEPVERPGRAEADDLVAELEADDEPHPHEEAGAPVPAGVGAGG